MSYFSQRQFKPQIWSTFAMLIGVAMLMGLGYWQLQRAEQKRVILEEYAQRANNKPLSWSDLNEFKSTMQYQQVELAGFYGNKQQFLLDNKFHQHRMGYHVITPFYSPTRDRVILVDRGWVPQGPSRQQLPILKPIVGQQTIKGRLYTLSRNTIRVGAAIVDNQNWPLRIEALDSALLQKLLGIKIYPALLQLNAEQPHGFVRDWRIVVMPAARHTGYAVQWFALALTLLIIYTVLSFQRREEERDE